MSLSVRPIPCLKLEQAPADRVRIVIHDNGMGIAPEMLTRIPRSWVAP